MLLGVLDLESTGVDPTKDRIVEIAVIIYDLDSGVERMRYERRVNPGIHIPAGASNVHGIMDGDVMNAPRFEQLAPGVKSLIERLDVVVGHNAREFDAPLLACELARAGVDISKMRFPPVFDTMLEGRFACADGKVPTLGELCWALDVPYDTTQAHQALYDVEVNLAAFREGLRLGVFNLPTTSQPQE